MRKRQTKLPEKVPEEMAAFAIAELMLGRTYRAVQRNIETRWQRTLDLHTLYRLFSADPKRVADYHRDQMQRMLERNFRVSQLATEIIEDRLEQGPATLAELNFVKGTAEDKVINMAKLAQDEKHSNLLRDALRTVLRMQPAERLTLAESIANDGQP